MLTNYFTLRLIASTLDGSLRNRQIVEIACYQKNTLTLTCKGESRRLLILCDRLQPTAYLHGKLSRPSRNVMKIFPGETGAVLTGIDVPSPDRVLRIKLSNRKYLFASLYGPAPNVFLCSPEGNILDSFKKLRQHTIATPRDQQNLTPDHGVALRNYDLVLDIEGFQKSISAEGNASALAVFRKSFSVLGKTLALESFARADLPASLRSADLDSRNSGALKDAVYSILSDLDHPTPRIYLGPGERAAYFSLIPLLIADGLDERVFEDISNAVHFFLARSHTAAALGTDKENLLTVLRRHAERSRRALEAMETDNNTAVRGSQYEQWGFLIMQNLALLRKGMRSFNAETAHGALVVPLEQSLTPVQNAQRYFDRSKRARNAIASSSGRRKQLESRLRKTERILALVEQSQTMKELKSVLAENSKALEDFGLRKNTRDADVFPFRRFVVDGGFEVWAGKSGANNDLLTFRYAKPSDLWFHASGAGGSHVILKVGTGKGEPGKKAREQTAAIAAFYSKLKGASIVPVAVTQRRHVRKPRGAPPGTVVIERERVVFAKPSLPQRAEDSKSGASV
jgi:predicted ribosome quality control (RQC) complex YloA/Tae2 family protein